MVIAPHESEGVTEYTGRLWGHRNQTTVRVQSLLASCDDAGFASEVVNFSSIISHASVARHFRQVEVWVHLHSLHSETTI